MTEYKYPRGTVWLSHSSISDFEKCPRLYYLHNVYREKPDWKKIQVVNPYLTLGIVVHDTIEQIRYVSKEDRFKTPLTDMFSQIWEQNSGKFGGFVTSEQEKEFRTRGLAMVKHIEEHPGPLANWSTIIKKKGEMVADMWLSQENGLVLCGNVDWVEVLPDGSLHIIDFKTGRQEEDESSLQLQIYLLLAKHGNKRPVTKLSYWYLDSQPSPREISLPDTNGVVELLIEKGKKMKAARELAGGLPCPSGGCRYCLEYEKAVKGEAERIGYDEKREKILYFVN